MSYVAVIGTGLMGSAIARALLDAGLPTVVWNRDVEKSRKLEKEGARIAPDIASAIAGTELVISVLSNYAITRAVLEKASDAIEGKTVVNLATGSDIESEAASEYFTSLGVQYLDGAIEAYPADIGKANTLINYSGCRPAWETSRDVLRLIAGSSEYLGEEAGLANVLDTAIGGALFQTALGGFIEAASYARTKGLPVGQIQKTTDYILEAVKTKINEGCIDIEEGRWETDQATINVYLAAMKVWRDQMRAVNGKVALMSANISNLEVACKAGLGEKSIFAQILTEPQTSASTV